MVIVRGVKPPWIKGRIPQGRTAVRLRRIIERGGLHTVCQEAMCPNIGHCWAEGRATLMILGDRCSRSCRFCGVPSGVETGKCDEDEPERVAEAVRAMGLRSVVITSVTRDDLPDGGAAVWARTIQLLRERVAGILIEVLVPDFRGSEAAIDEVVAAGPDVFGHNLETVARLYGVVRPGADYGRSLRVLRRVRDSGMITKTGMMTGLGERTDEVLEVMGDAVASGCSIFTAGQYLQPTRRHLSVQRYVDPVEFDGYRDEGLRMGLAVVVAGPLVRSSLHSSEQEEFVRGILGERRSGRR